MAISWSEGILTTVVNCRKVKFMPELVFWQYMAVDSDEGKEMDIDLTAEEAEEVSDLVSGPLIGSGERIRIFLCLNQGISETAEIEKKVGCGKSTVSKAKRRLRNNKLLKTDGKELTRRGRVVGSAFETFVERTTDIQRWHRLFSEVDSFGSLRIDDDFEDKTRTEQTNIETDQNAIWMYRNLIEESHDVRKLVPWRTGVGRFFLEKLQSDDVTGEFVFHDFDLEDEPLEEKDLFYELTEAGATLLDTDLALPDFHLGIYDETVALMAHGDQRVRLETDDESVLKWAEREYERYHSESDEFLVKKSDGEYFIQST